MAAPPAEPKLLDYPLTPAAEPLGSDNAAPTATDVAPVTAEEILNSGQVPITPEPKKKKKAADAAPGAPRKKPKKKGLVSASPAVDSGPRYYYDIQNFIVTGGVDLEQFGLLPSSPTVPSGVTNTSVGKRISPDPAPSLPVNMPSISGPKLNTTTDELLVVASTNQKITSSCVFCPECGLRLAKHPSRRLPTETGEKAIFVYCPE